MSDFVLPVSWLLYILVFSLMLQRGWPIRASLAMAIAALLPWVVWHFTAPGPWGPGAGIVLFITAGQLILALVLFVAGLTTAALRLKRSRTAST